jgi:hypothetical protein
MRLYKVSFPFPLCHDLFLPSRLKSGLILLFRLFCCAWVISENFSQLPLNIYKREANGDTNIAHDFHVQKLICLTSAKCYNNFAFEGGFFVRLFIFTGEKKPPVRGFEVAF